MISFLLPFPDPPSTKWGGGADAEAGGAFAQMASGGGESRG